VVSRFAAQVQLNVSVGLARLAGFVMHVGVLPFRGVLPYYVRLQDGAGRAAERALGHARCERHPVHLGEVAAGKVAGPGLAYMI
jgi:hypothetical protein